MAPRRDEQDVAIAWGDGGELALEGIFVAGGDADSGGAVLAPPHPLMGGSMSSPVLDELAHACAGAGLATLRFNWRGVGASAGEPSGENADADEDYGAALRHLAETVPGAIVACGYSFGACAALRAAVHPRVRRLVVVAPPVALLDAAALADFARPLLVIAGENDAYAPPDRVAPIVDAAPRATFVCIAETDHFFAAGLAEISRAASRFLGA